MRISLFITCYNDLLFPNTGIAVVRLLERLGARPREYLQQELQDRLFLPMLTEASRRLPQLRFELANDEALRQIQLENKAAVAQARCSCLSELRPRKVRGGAIMAACAGDSASTRAQSHRFIAARMALARAGP